jgi:hypothetical protein
LGKKHGSPVKLPSAISVHTGLFVFVYRSLIIHSKTITMAEAQKNDVTLGLSGKFGQMFVFRQLAGKTYATRAPGERTKEPSAEQKVNREKFQKAILYGKTVIADPLMKKDYQEKAEPGKSAFNVAVADFFKAPDILDVDLTGYTGQVGQKIRIRVTDDFAVKSVVVTIHNGDGTLQEEGDAALEENQLDWIYTTNSNNTSLTGDKITIIAADIPDNLTKQEKVM